ncbi:MAG: DUF6519 domain-containing protein [Gemmatimonadota bacterium]
MPGDYTRFTFDTLKNHIGVLMQQGRVMLDADFNEFVEIMERRIQASDLDTLGPCVVPRETIHGFEISTTGGTLSIGPGRMYVHGILAENHGADPQEWDDRLEELRGTGFVPFDQQPHLPGATTPPDGTYLAYLDVWQREVTHLEDAEILEKAVGVDTATRLQTVWQVRLLDLANTQGVSCDTDPASIPGWDTQTAPSGGRLSTQPVGVLADDDPCVVSPTGGFRGTENRLYRVEVHDGGAIGTATFKWSHDNASVAAAVRGVNAAGTELRVTRTARDDVLRFSANDWVEIIDDDLELTQQPGVMRRVTAVDDVTETLTLHQSLLGGSFDLANPRARNLRVRKWDQKGQVLNAAGTVVADVDTNSGVIPITGPATYVLEDGVEVTFSLDPSGGDFHVGDYWVFEARTVDASIQELNDAPPRGIHHHYCRLAVVTLPGQPPEDCRTFWPPEFGGAGCDCTVCVSAEEHNSGSRTIQMAINAVKATGGKVCLGPGLYLVQDPIMISSAFSVHLQGHGLTTALLYGGPEGGVIQVEGSVDVDISQLAVTSYALENVGRPSLTVRNSMLVNVEHCTFIHLGSGRDEALMCVGLAGVLVEVRVRDNVLFGARGIDTLGPASGGITPPAAEGGKTQYTGTLGLYIEDNFIWGTERCVSLDSRGGTTFHLGDTRISRNTMFGGEDEAVRLTGYTLPVSRTDVKGNEIVTRGHGVIVAEDNVRVEDNDISAVERDSGVDGPPMGIAITQGTFETPILRCSIVGNRIFGLGGDGINIRTTLGAATIERNFIQGTGRNGIAMEPNAGAQVLNIENNQILGASTVNEDGVAVCAIRVLQVAQGEISGNTIRDFGLYAVQNDRRSGIEAAMVGSVRIAGNDIQGVGPPTQFVGAGAGIGVLGPFGSVEVVDNMVRRTSGGFTPDNSLWYGLMVTIPIAKQIEALGSVWSTFGEDAVIYDTSAPAEERARSYHRVGTYLENNAVIDAANRGFVMVVADEVVLLPRGQHLVSVRGNSFQGFGLVPVVHVLSAGTCTFTDNRCLQHPPAGRTPLIVDIESAAAIVSSNYLERPTVERPRASMDIDVDNGPVTVLGNIATGDIHVNGADLPPSSPWRPLNVIV